MSEIEHLKFQLNMANNTICHLERIREDILKKNKTLNKKLKVAKEALEHYSNLLEVDDEGNEIFYGKIAVNALEQMKNLGI